MNPRHFLVALFVVGIISGIYEGFCISHGVQLSNAYNLIVTILMSICVYLWYYFDAVERKYRRTIVLGGFMIMFAVFAAPYYLARSRPKGERAKAIALFIGLLLLLIAIGVAVPALVQMASPTSRHT